MRLTRRFPIHSMIAASLAMTGFSAADLAAAESWNGYITFQINGGRGYAAQDLDGMLHDAIYLASIDRGMVHSSIPMEARGESVQVAVQSTTPGLEILSVKVSGSDEEAVQSALQAISNHLQSLQPTERVFAEGEISHATEELKEAEEEFRSSLNERRTFLERNGAIEPSTQLQIVRTSLMGRTQEAEELKLDLAGNRGVRDYLTTMLREPSVPVNEERIAEIQRAVDDLEKEYAELSKSKTKTHPEVARVAKQLFDLRVELDATMEKSSNQFSGANRMSWESELFSVSRKISLSENRLAVLNDEVTRLAQEATRLGLLDGTWRRTNEAYIRASNRRDQAESRLAQARSQVRRELSGEWIKVIAGPTFAK